MSSTAPHSPGKLLVPHHAAWVAVITLFIVMTALLLSAVLVPLPAGPAGDATPRPAPAPAPAPAPFR